MVYFDSQGFQFPDMSAYYPWEIPTAPKTCAPGVRIFSPDGSLFAFACSKIDLFDVSNKRPIKEWDSGSQTISSIAFSPDNQLLATGDVGGTIQVWNLADTKAVVTLKAHIGPVNFLDFSADGRYILSSSTIYMINDGTSYPGDSTIRTWGIP